MELDARIPSGPIAEKWDNHRFGVRLVAPHNRRRFDVIIVGTGLAGAAAAATLGELGYRVKAFTFHDSPRRAHSIAAQGGINAAKDYRNDGDSTYRLFYDTVKGGDYRSREANVYRLTQVSGEIIDQCTAQGVPFAREYGGLLDNRSFGGAQVSRTFYARGQTGQQLLLGAYQAMMHQVELGAVELHRRAEMLDLVIQDGRAAGIVVRDLHTGEITSHSAHAVVLATGGYSNVFYLSTNAKASNATAIWSAHRRGAAFANPCFTQIHPTCIPPADETQSKLTLMSESLRNDGRIGSPSSRTTDVRRARSRRGSATTTWSAATRRSATSCPATWRRSPSQRRVPRLRRRHRPPRSRRDRGALREPVRRCTTGSPVKTRTRCRCASTPRRTTRWVGLWVDYNLMATIPGLYVAGEANFSDHGANRLGASALMQGLADGYFVLPNTINDYLAGLLGTAAPSTDTPAFREAEHGVRDQIGCFVAAKGKRTVDWFHRALGKIMWEHCGMARSAEGLTKALVEIPALREEFDNDVRVLGGHDTLNQSLERAGRVADFFELAELMCRDALHREESCGGHFRVEHQTDDGEALRNDDRFAYVAAWEWNGQGQEPILHREPLNFEHVQLAQRSYK